MADRNGLVAADGAKTRRAIAGLALPMTIADVVLFVEIIGVVALLGRVSNEALYIRSLTMPILLLFVAMSTAFAITYQVMASISRGRERPQDLVPTAVALLRVFVVTGVVLSAGSVTGVPVAPAAAVPVCVVAGRTPVTCTLPVCVGRLPPVNEMASCWLVGVAMPRAIRLWRAVSRVWAIRVGGSVPCGVKVVIRT